MTKSQQYFQDMMDYNKPAFDAFKIIHDKYPENPKKYQEELNEEGEKILTIIRKYENLLCNTSESGKYGKFSNKTADTFWGFIRKAFPQIDFVGLKQ
jgi:hypothetical protein